MSLDFEYTRMNLVALVTAITIFALNGTGFAMKSPTAMTCNVSDPKAILSSRLTNDFCTQLSRRLGVLHVPQKQFDAMRIKTRSQDIIFLDVRIATKSTAEYRVFTGKPSNIDLDGAPDLGPLIVEAMDANIEHVLADHIYNDLKRFLSEK